MKRERTWLEEKSRSKAYDHAFRPNEKGCRDINACKISDEGVELSNAVMAFRVKASHFPTSDDLIGIIKALGYVRERR